MLTSLAIQAAAVFVFVTDTRNPSVAENVNCECKVEIGLAKKLLMKFHPFAVI